MHYQEHILQSRDHSVMAFILFVAMVVILLFVGIGLIVASPFILLYMVVVRILKKEEE